MHWRFSTPPPLLRRYNTYAFRYAKLRGLPMTAASDAHHAAAVGTAYTILSCDELSVKCAVAQIVKSNELNQRYLTPRDSMRKTWNNWLRLRRKKLPEITNRDSRYFFCSGERTRLVQRSQRKIRDGEARAPPEICTAAPTVIPVTPSPLSRALSGEISQM